MPLGVIVNTVSIAAGGIAGVLIKERLSAAFKENLSMVFGVCSMGMGISSIVLMENMPAVIFSIVVGTAFGLAVRLGDRLEQGAGLMQRAVSGLFRGSTGTLSEKEFMETLVTVIVLFCASGTGIYGSIVSGMTGDHSILIAKSVLDLFTALIFACVLGGVVSFVAIPQLVIFLALFACAGVIYPLTTPSMVNDFKAAGGFLMLATGFRMIKVKMFPTADMIPSMVLVFPVSWLWTTCILPVLS
ncbi:MAG: DUF554 domain-containing protein [Eubacteriales bacterium]|nr:DUF554 domain-containing protein [Eubacteriales bacterium]